MNEIRSVSVIGLGYIGLPTAVLLATSGHRVFGVDINLNIVNDLNSGKAHISEPGLSEPLMRVVETGMLTGHELLQEADVYIICVPTPVVKSEDKAEADLSAIWKVTDVLSVILKKGDMIILESTSPVGTTDELKKRLEHLGVNTRDISIAYCPERVLPGNMMYELINNERIVGGITPEAGKIVGDFMATYISSRISYTDAKTAELAKLTENSFRDVNIAFANELALICDNEDINVLELVSLVNRHPRVNVLQPGTGVGGHCIAVDPWFIVSRDAHNSKLIRTARDRNDGMPIWVVNKIKDKVDSLGSRLSVKVACLGLSYKPDVEDLRESPALQIVNKLIDEGYSVKTVEPNLNESFFDHQTSINEAIYESDLLVFLVAHAQFKTLDFKAKISDKEYLDFCGINHSN